MPRRAGIAGFITCLVIGTGCVTPRYVGKTTPDGTFVHRAYGFVVDLRGDREWKIVEYGDDAVPYALWPQWLASGRVDLDGDGQLESTEIAPHYDPILRLWSRTSTTVVLDVDVEVVRSSTRTPTARDRLTAELRDGPRPYRIERRTVTPSTPVWIGSCAGCGPQAPTWIAVVDHRDFEAEYGRRHQLIWFRIYGAPGESGRARLRAVLAQLVLARRADAKTRNESF